MVQPKPAASCESRDERGRRRRAVSSARSRGSRRCRRTRYSSATTTRAPWPAAIRAARTPPEPPPIDEQIDVEIRHHRSSGSASSGDQISLPRLRISARNWPLTSSAKLCAHCVHVLACWRRSTSAPATAASAERRFVEGHEILQFLLGEVVGVDLGHLLADLLLTAGQLLATDHRDLLRVLLVVQIVLHSVFMVRWTMFGTALAYNRAGVLQRQDFLRRRDRCRRAGFCGAGAWACASADNASASAMPAANTHSRQTLHFNSPGLRRDGRSTMRIPFGPASNDDARETNEQAMLDDARDHAQQSGQAGGIGDSPEMGVHDPVAAIGDESMAVLAAAQLQFARRRRSPRSACSIARRVAASPNGITSIGSGNRPKRIDPFGFVGNHDHAFRSRGDDLLAQQRAAAALDQVERADRSRRRRRPSGRADRPRSSVVSGTPQRSASARVTSDVGTPTTFRPALHRARPATRRNAWQSSRCRARAACRRGPAPAPRAAACSSVHPMLIRRVHPLSRGRNPRPRLRGGHI